MTCASRGHSVIKEDMHWSDDTSLECVQYQGRHYARQPLTVLLTYRSDEIGPSLRHWLAHMDRESLPHEIALTHLTHSETGAMLQAIFKLKRPVPACSLVCCYLAPTLC